MEGRSSSSKQRNNGSMEERPELKEELPFPGSCIRSLVKQLSSSRPREVTDVSSSDAPLIAGEHSPDDPPCKTSPKQPPPSQIPPQQPRKQARRRLNTTRPYQERLLNMAEARREIVTALKFHRAAMRQASQQQKQRSPASQKTAASCSHQSYFPPLFSYTSPSWAYHHQFAPPPVSDKLINITLPNQPLGLTLNFQGFADVETALFRSNGNESAIPHPPTPSSSSSSSSSTSSISSPSPCNSNPSPATMACAATDAPASIPNSIPSDPILHPAMGDEEMEEIRSMSEKHGMEWNDAVNSVSTVWWSKFLKGMEVDDNGENREGEAFQMFSEVTTTIPASPSEGSCMDYCRGNYLLDSHVDDDQLQDAATLPW